MKHPKDDPPDRLRQIGDFVEDWLGGADELQKGGFFDPPRASTGGAEGGADWE